MRRLKTLIKLKISTFNLLVSSWIIHWSCIKGLKWKITKAIYNQLIQPKRLNCYSYCNRNGILNGPRSFKAFHHGGHLHFSNIKTTNNLTPISSFSTKRKSLAYNGKFATSFRMTCVNVFSVQSLRIPNTVKLKDIKRSMLGRSASWKIFC